MTEQHKWNGWIRSGKGEWKLAVSDDDNDACWRKLIVLKTEEEHCEKCVLPAHRHPKETR